MLKTDHFPAVLPDDLAGFTRQQQQWLKKAQDFARAIPLLDIIKADVDNEFRRDLFEEACRQGFGGLPFPTGYGGSGGDYLSFCLVNEEFARRLVPIMSSLGVHILCQEPIYRFGDEEQKRRYLIPSSSGEFLAAFGLTEPGAGSDTAALATTARLIGDEYILNGTKTFITSGGAADYYIVMARLKGSGPPEQDSSQISSFIVERSFQGFELGQKFDMLGMRGYSTSEIVFNDCRVPKANLLGEPGWGRKVALSSLAKGRVTIAAQATGWAQAALDTLTNHLSSLRRCRTKAADHNDALGLAGGLAAEVAGARLMTHQAAYAIDRGEPDVMLASMAKIQATDLAMKAATEAISVLGLDGLSPNFLLERVFRDAKAGQIYEGTNQIQRLLIARQLFK